jgi:hypothetical protein
MEWITARDLERWADTVDGRTALSELVSSLIRGSAREITSFRFPTGDSAQLPDYDGSLEASGTPPFVPDGKSVWEFGNGSDYLRKAELDLEARTDNPLGATPGEAVFVFVTARTWKRLSPSKQEWQQERTDRGPWKAVKFIDGVDLQTWLELCPAVAARAARDILAVMPTNGAKSTQEFWDEFAARFRPPLDEAVPLAGRSKQADALLERLKGKPGAYFLRGDTADEVAAFAVAAIRTAAEDVKKFLESRTLVVDTPEAASALAVSCNLIFLALPGTASASGQLSKRGPVVVPITREDPGVDGAEALRAPTTQEFSEALAKMGFTPGEAELHARATARSLTVLGRRIRAAHASRPSWADDQTLIPALLAGSWDSAAGADRDIVCELAGAASYEDYERQLRHYTQSSDPPIKREGQIWQVSAPVDAFTQLAHLGGDEHLRRLRSACHRVFAEVDPAIDLRPEARPYARLHGQETRHSIWLRDGIATALLLIAALGEGVGLTAPGGPQAYVNEIVRSLPGLDRDWRVLASLRAQLPLLMEAAPRPLFEALEQLLEGDGSKLRPIFQEDGGLFASSAHTGLLWALEVAAWDPEWLSRATLALARLARIDPGGKLQNRPINSLREIFLPWHPGTNATLAERLAAIDQIISREPEVGWQLITRLLPADHDVSGNTAAPRFREPPGGGAEPLTNRIVWETYSAAIDRALEIAGDDPDRWPTIIQGLPAFDSGHRQAALARLAELARRASEGVKTRLWTPLRELVNNHRAFPTAVWSMKGADLDELESIAKNLEPSDSIARIAWLFDDYYPRLPEPAILVDTAGAERERATQLAHLYAEHGRPAIMALARAARLPHLVGLGAARVVNGLTEVDHLVSEALQEGGKLGGFSAALSSAAEKGFGPAWHEHIRGRLERGEWSPIEVANLVTGWPDTPQTWDFTASLGPGVDGQYWKQKPAWPIFDDADSAARAAECYLAAGRATSALAVIRPVAAAAPADLVLRALDRTAEQLAGEPSHLSPDVVVTLEEVLAAARQRSEIPQTEVARREYAFLPLLHHSAGTPTLHAIMAADPGFFASVLRDAFRPAAGESAPPGEQARRRARAAYQLLMGMKTVPGGGSGTIESTALRAWVISVRELAVKDDRSGMADVSIGQILAYSPSDADGGWPAAPVRELIEEIGSQELEDGIIIGRRNARGVFHKAMYEGGGQERGLARQAAEWATVATGWPRTQAMLRRLAGSWEEHAKREDQRAKHDEMRFER